MASGDYDGAGCCVLVRARAPTRATRVLGRISRTTGPWVESARMFKDINVVLATPVRSENSNSATGRSIGSSVAHRLTSRLSSRPQMGIVRARLRAYWGLATPHWIKGVSNTEERGFIQRLMVYAPKDRLGERVFRTEPVPDKISDAYH
jgi:hypothetical protein